MAEMLHWGWYQSYYSTVLGSCWQHDENSFVTYHMGGYSSASTSRRGHAVKHTRDKTSIGGNRWYYPVGYSNYNLRFYSGRYQFLPTEYDPILNYMIIECQNEPYQWRSTHNGLRVNFYRYNNQKSQAFDRGSGYINSMLENGLSYLFGVLGVEGRTRTNYLPGLTSVVRTNLGYYSGTAKWCRPTPNSYLVIGETHPTWNSSTTYGGVRYYRHPGDDSPNRDNDELYPQGASNTEFVGNAACYYAARVWADGEEDVKQYRSQPPKTLSLRTFWREPMNNAVDQLIEGEPSSVKVSYDPDTWGKQYDTEGNVSWGNPNLHFTDYTLGARPAGAGPDWMPISRLLITNQLNPDKNNIRYGTFKYHIVEFSPMEQVYYRNSNDINSQPNGYDDIFLRHYETRNYTNQTANYDDRDKPYDRNNNNWHMTDNIHLCTGTSITVPFETRYKSYNDEQIPIWSISLSNWLGYIPDYGTPSINPMLYYSKFEPYEPEFYFSSNDDKYPRSANVRGDPYKDAKVINYDSWYADDPDSLLNFDPYANGEKPHLGNNSYRAPFADIIIDDGKAYTWTLNWSKRYILVTVDLGEVLDIEVEVLDELPKKITDKIPLYKILTEGKTPEGLYYAEPQMYLYESGTYRYIQRKNSAYYYVPAFAGSTGTSVPSRRYYDENGTLLSTPYPHGWPLPIVPVQMVRSSRVDGKTIRTDIGEGQGNSLWAFANAYWSRPPIAIGSEYYRDIEFGGFAYHKGRGQMESFIFDYKDVGYGEPIPLKLNQRDDGLGIHGGPGRLGYFGQNGGWSSRLPNGGSW